MEGLLILQQKEDLNSLVVEEEEDVIIWKKQIQRLVQALQNVSQQWSSSSSNSSISKEDVGMWIRSQCPTDSPIWTDPDEFVKVIVSTCQEHSSDPEVAASTLLNELLGFDYFDFVSTLLQDNDKWQSILHYPLQSSTQQQQEGSTTTTMTTESESQRRLEDLKQRALELANQAAIWKAQLTPMEGSSSNSNHQVTHSVTRSSEKEAWKEYKRLSKQAARAWKEAVDAGAILPSTTSSALLTEFDEEMEARMGLQGMTLEQIQEMKDQLLPEGTKQYYENQGNNNVLPAGASRDHVYLPKAASFEQVVVPPKLVDTTMLPARIPLHTILSKAERKTFGSTIESLNPMQSQVAPSALDPSLPNLLICAPTGAGKTNVALLCIIAHLRHIGLLPNPHHPTNNNNNNDPYAAYAHIGTNTTTAGTNANNTNMAGKKIIYVAPMKALAAEVTEKLSGALKALKVEVKEFTGDMQLTKAQAERADILVTTPEKWDVVTRKNNADSNSLGRSCGLLLLDEVHLLADDRGAVIESLVARLHRMVETTQVPVRLVGLSATLPNPLHVAQFLSVSNKHLFEFGQEYRPIPLQQTFCGLHKPSNQHFQKEIQLNTICWHVVSNALSRGYQAMVFVHSRKGTSDTAQALYEIALEQFQWEDLLGGQDYEVLRSPFLEKVNKSRNKQLQTHFHHGFGIHHAGMLRNDRKLSESMFAAGAIRVLCCTSTLAWGINLPAHTVVIKGTDVYNSEKGQAVDLSILDVQQIFGRAGRPQYGVNGEATLITSNPQSLARYVRKLVTHTPIESNFIKFLPDHLNAEIVSGTVTNIPEAIEWLTYTYLYVRMLSNPMTYGISYDARESDPTLRQKCRDLVHEAAKTLDQYEMVNYDVASGNLSVTELGRVASHFYIRSESIAIFEEMLKRKQHSMREGDFVHMVCCAQEFENVKVRPDELDEMDKLKNNTKDNTCPLSIPAPLEEFSGKCSVLLQAYISNEPNHHHGKNHSTKSFTLISDTNYISANAGRVARALFEMCLKRNMAPSALQFLRVAKSIDKRLWWFSKTPLRQFEGELREHIYKSLEKWNASYDDTIALLDMTPQEVGQYCHLQKDSGAKIQRLISYLPRLAISCQVQPVTSTIVRFQVHLQPLFEWHTRWHGASQSFWLWVEDSNNDRIYHHEYVLFQKRTFPDPMELELTIPVFEATPSLQYYIRVVSDTWVGPEMLVPVSFRHLSLPQTSMPYTDLLDLTPLPITALQNDKYELLYKPKFDTFNPIQTQLFHILYHTNTPVLLGAPTGSGKTIVAEIALLRMKNIDPKGLCVYIAPLKSLARERLKEWRARLGSPPLNWKVLELSGDTSHDLRAMTSADVLVCTPEKWDLISRGWQQQKQGNHNNRNKFIQKVRLLIIDEIHLLGEERGAVLEAIVSRTRFISRFAKEEQQHKNEKPSSQSTTNNKKDGEHTRIIGLSTAIANPMDLADWIGINVDGYGVDVKRGLYNFRPSVRPIPMEVHISGFPGRHYCPRMATMNKPCYAAIKQHSPTKPVIIFVASRRQTRLTALDLISYAAGDENPQNFLHCSDDYAQQVASTLSDSSLRHTLTFGIGLHHAGLSSHDREIVEKMFLDREIQVLVATATLAWGVNLPAHLVIVKGTEYFDGKTSRYVDYPVTDVLQMMGRAGRPGFDDKGIACVMVEQGKKNFYKKFLYDPFPVESCLSSRLPENMNAEIAIGSITSVHDAVGYLSWTFFARRVKVNHSYYGAESAEDNDQQEFFYATVKETIQKLLEEGCLKIPGNEDISDDALIESSILGTSASRFYLDYRTPLQMYNSAKHVSDIVSKLILESKSSLKQGVAETKENMSVESSRDEMDQKDSSSFSFGPAIEIAGVASILFALAQTHEFDEIPVRHNEEHLNLELSEKLPWGPDTKAALNYHDGRNDSKHNPNDVDLDIMADPHTKCYLLLQSFILRAKLPISDYINDMRSVFDQIPRLLAAMQFISLDSTNIAGNFDFQCLLSITRQVLTSRTMPGINPLNQITGKQRDTVRKLQAKGISSLKQLRSLKTAERSKILRVISDNHGRKLANNSPESFLMTLPDFHLENISIDMQVDKTTGVSYGKLSLNLILKNDNYKTKADTKTDISIIVGSPVGHYLLCQKSMSLQKSSNKQQAEKNIEHKVDLKFDWAKANANAGPDGGIILVRIFYEACRGLDMEYTVPLRRNN